MSSPSNLFQSYDLKTLTFKFDDANDILITFEIPNSIYIDKLASQNFVILVSSTKELPG
jgi:hypothetical protein